MKDEIPFSNDHDQWIIYGYGKYANKSEFIQILNSFQNRYAIINEKLYILKIEKNAISKTRRAKFHSQDSSAK